MPNFTCTHDFTYFSSPDFLQLSLRFISILSTPIFILGTYCILFKTPAQMNTVKYYLLTLHLTIYLFCYSTSVLTIPYLLIPQFGAVIYGDALLIGIPMSVSVMIPLIALAFILITVQCVHENRFFILCEFRFREQWRFWRWVYCMAHYIAAFVFLIPVFFMIPNQETARLIVVENLPCLPESIYNSPKILVLARDLTYHICYIITFGIFHFTEVSFFVLLIIRNTRKQSRKMSTKTYEMHKKFFKGLGILILVPSTLVSFPLFYIYSAALISYHNQTVNNFSVIGLTMFGPLFTIVMIIVHKPYRLAIRGLIRRKDNEVQSTIASVGFTR